MINLERFINDPGRFTADPLIKMALIHHQFESIHFSTTAMAAPGASSTCCIWSRKACSTYRCCTSSHIVRPGELLPPVADRARERHAGRLGSLHAGRRRTNRRQTITTIHAIKTALSRLQALHPCRVQVLQPGLDQQPCFTHPTPRLNSCSATSRCPALTATKYMDALADGGFVQHKVGRSNPC